MKNNTRAKALKPKSHHFIWLAAIAGCFASTVHAQTQMIEVFRADFTGGNNPFTPTAGTSISVVNDALEVDFESRNSGTDFNNLQSPIIRMDIAGVVPESVVGAELEFTISAPSGTTPAALAAAFSGGDQIAGIVEILDDFGNLVDSTAFLGRIGSTPNIVFTDAATFDPLNQPTSATVNVSFSVDFPTDFPNGTQTRLNLVMRESGDGGTGIPGDAGLVGTDIILDDIVLRLEGTPSETQVIEVFSADFTGGVNPFIVANGFNVNVVNEALEIDFEERAGGTSFNNLSTPVFRIDGAGADPETIVGAEVAFTLSAPIGTTPSELAAAFSGGDLLNIAMFIFDDAGDPVDVVIPSARLFTTNNFGFTSANTFESASQPLKATIFVDFVFDDFASDFTGGTQSSLLFVFRESGDGGSGDPPTAGIVGTDIIFDDVSVSLFAEPSSVEIVETIILSEDFNDGFSVFSGNGATVNGGSLEFDFQERGGGTSFNNIAGPILDLTSFGIDPSGIFEISWAFTQTDLTGDFANAYLGSDQRGLSLTVLDANGTGLGGFPAGGEFTGRANLVAEGTYGSLLITSITPGDFPVLFPGGVSVAPGFFLREAGTDLENPIPIGVVGSDLSFDDIVITVRELVSTDVAISDLEITAFSFDAGTQEFTVTWNSLLGTDYNIVVTDDLTNFGAGEFLNPSVITAGGDSESFTGTVPGSLQGSTALFLRVEEVGP